VAPAAGGGIVLFSDGKEERCRPNRNNPKGCYTGRARQGNQGVPISTISFRDEDWHTRDERDSAKTVPGRTTIG